MKPFLQVLIVKNFISVDRATEKCYPKTADGLNIKKQKQKQIACKKLIEQEKWFTYDI